MLIRVLFFVGLTGTALSVLPPGITSCPGKPDPDEFNECVVQQLKILTPQLVKGIPSLKLPPLDPLALPSLVVDRSLEALKVKANLTNVRVYGGTNFLIDQLRANRDNLTVFINVHLPFVHVKGHYDVRGTLRLLNLNGKGAFRGNFTNTQTEVTAQGRKITDKNGVQRIEVKELSTKIRVGGGNIRLKAPPAQLLTADAATTFFNLNPRLVLDIINPIIEETAASIAKALAARALGALTVDELLP